MGRCPFNVSTLGEGEMRGWQLIEVNGMQENPFHGNCWQEASLARY